MFLLEYVYLYSIFFSDEAPDGLNLKTYPNEQTIKESKLNLSFTFYYEFIFIIYLLYIFVHTTFC